MNKHIIDDIDKVTEKGLNIFLLVIVSSIVFVIINVYFYQLKQNIEYIELIANIVMLVITFYLIYITQKNSTDKSGFYYYTSIGFAFVFFGFFIRTLDFIYIYRETVVIVSMNILFVMGYGLIAIGITKWVKYNRSRQEELSEQANTDELTGLLNRRSFTKYIEHFFQRTKVVTEPYSLIIVDIDFFKMVNDDYGHTIGDEVLKCLAKTMNNFFMTADKVCRWGGEEFAILLPNTTLTNAMTVAEKIRSKVENNPYQSKNTLIKYTISLGISESLTTDTCVDDIINRADKALYIAKESGRNCAHSIRA